jgi:hypothetical protein
MRTCLFCGATPVTDEHVVPNWMAKVLGVETMNVHDYRRGKVWEVGGDSFELIAKHFCGPRCNRGWMRDLENAVIPFLSPLLLRRSSVTREQQRVLGRWMWKTFLTASTCAAGAEPIFVPSDFVDFYRTRRVPGHTLMWLGGFRTTSTTARLDSWSIGLKQGSFDVGQQRCMTLSVGKLLLQVRQTIVADHITFDPGDRSSEWASCVTQFWPIDSVTIRQPEEAVGPEEFARFSDRWLPDGVSSGLRL